MDCMFIQYLNKAISSLTLLKTDGVLPYIDWAIKNGFGVLDVNIPMNTPNLQVSAHTSLFYSTDLIFGNAQDEEYGITERADEAQLQAQMTELMCYLWDNYLEGYESHDIVLMGVGYSYLGVKMLLTSRGQSPILPLSPSYFPFPKRD